jgi:hypothetical protein
MSRVIIERAEPRVIIDRSPTVTRLIRLVEKGDLGATGPPGPSGQPAALGGSLRSVSSKAEAGGPLTPFGSDDQLDFSVTNRFTVTVNGPSNGGIWSFANAISLATLPAGTTFEILMVNIGGTFDWTGVTWPDPGTPPMLVDDENKATSLAFKKYPNGQWLGFVGPVHAWNGV